jgi:hypothetical protein
MPDHNRDLLLRIRDSKENICLQKSHLGVEHRVKHQKCDLSLYKSVAEPSHGFNTGVVSRLGQDLSQTLHIYIDGALIDLIDTGPNLRQ